MRKEQPLKFKCDQLVSQKLLLLKIIDDEIFHMLDDNEIDNEVVECKEINSDIQNAVVLLEERRNPLAVNVANKPVVV